MRKVILVLASIIAINAANAQTGKNQIGIGFEVGKSTESGSKAAFGGSAKYLHGVGTAGQVTLSAGYLTSSSTETDGTDEYKATVSMIPIMVGYRHNFSGLYVEPQLGYVSSKAKIKFNGSELGSASDGSFGYAIGLGYAMEQGLDLGVRFLNTTQSGSKGMFVFRLGYNFTLGGASSSK